MLMTNRTRRLDAFRGCGGCGPTQGSWRCAPCETESQLEAYGLFGDDVAGSTSAAVVASSRDVSALQSVIMGITTGLAVWAATRFMESRVLPKVQRARRR